MTAKPRKTFIRIFFILAVVVTSIVLIRAVFNYTTGKKLEKYLEAVRAKGVPLSIKDFVPQCPDASNGAPLWKAAEALILIEKPDGPLMARITDVLTFEKPFDEKFRKDLASLVEKNKKALELAAEASARPCFRFGDWDQPLGDPRLIGMVRITRLLAADAVLRADRGEIREALNECQAGLRLAWKIMDEPELITSLVALADAKLMLFAFHMIARGREMDRETLDTWMKEMDISAWRNRLSRCIPFERAYGFEWGLRTISGKPAVFSGALGTQTEGTGFDNFFSWLVRPILKSQFIWVHQWYGNLERISGDPYYRQNEFLKKQRLEPVPWYYKPTGVLLPEFHSVFLKEATLEAMMLATRAGLACKIYKIKTGRYPENLGALVPDILPEIPIDPFTGKPLVYKIENGELLIYSLGSNQKDDGGRGSPITQLVMEKDDDWTWREKIK